MFFQSRPRRRRRRRFEEESEKEEEKEVERREKKESDRPTPQERAMRQRRFEDDNHPDPRYFWCQARPYSSPLLSPRASTGPVPDRTAVEEPNREQARPAERPEQAPSSAAADASPSKKALFFFPCSPSHASVLLKQRFSSLATASTSSDGGLWPPERSDRETTGEVGSVVFSFRRRGRGRGGLIEARAMGETSRDKVKNSASLFFFPSTRPFEREKKTQNPCRALCSPRRSKTPRASSRSRRRPRP